MKISKVIFHIKPIPSHPWWECKKLLKIYVDVGLLFTLQMNDIFWKIRTMTVAFQRIFGILERWNNNQVTPSLSKSHELSYRSNSLWYNASVTWRMFPIGQHEQQFKIRERPSKEKSRNELWNSTQFQWKGKELKSPSTDWNQHLSWKENRN